ncbi:GNAT family N-acetyltransferase [Enemella sp. A6]|uniref:GNAT family N-acetyltransferase n=1 Tax=Enemella sp. A6 TaxID=3440152 RepID=UPI003EBD11AB
MNEQKRRLVHNHGATQYELLINGVQAGYLDYELSGDLVVMHTTFMSEEYKGQGLGSSIVEAALQDARANGRKVVPRCPFVQAYLAKHPEYAEVVA